MRTVVNLNAHDGFYALDSSSLESKVVWEDVFVPPILDNASDVSMPTGKLPHFTVIWVLVFPTKTTPPFQSNENLGGCFLFKNVE